MPTYYVRFKVTSSADVVNPDRENTRLTIYREIQKRRSEELLKSRKVFKSGQQERDSRQRDRTFFRAHEASTDKIRSPIVKGNSE